MPGRFVSGLELSRRLYDDGVAPLLAAHFPTLLHSAALIGAGSEVLGYDTERSVDHDWGPRLQLFLSTQDRHRVGQDVDVMLAERLPRQVLGYSTHFVTDDGRTRTMSRADGPVKHGVEVTDPGRWFDDYLGFDPRGAISTGEWLRTPTQILVGVTSGAVFHDGLGELGPARAGLTWYPVDVWRYVLSCQWQRIAEEEAFVGRCGEVGDELGSAVVAARLVRDVMRMELLLHRCYPPYSKWLGTAFARLADAQSLGIVLTRVVTARGSGDREDALAAAYEHVGRVQNELGLAASVDPTTRPFHNRPFRVLHAERFAEALRSSIVDPAIRALPLVGAIDQWIDSTAALGRRCRLDETYRAMTAGDDLDGPR